jgi:hypothetical protein
MQVASGSVPSLNKRTLPLKLPLFLLTLLDVNANIYLEYDASTAIVASTWDSQL